MSELTHNDYKHILEYYNKPLPKSARLLKKNAEKILSSKLCRCIKKMTPRNKNEGRAIGMCTRTVINSKGFKRGKFTCKKANYIKLTKKNVTKKSISAFKKGEAKI
jgi:hypothetical protein